MAGPWEAYAPSANPSTAAASGGPWNAYAVKPQEQPKQESLIPAAITDIPSEVGKSYTDAIQHVTGNSVNDLPGYDPRTRGQLGTFEGLARTGKQILGVPELLASLPVGLARSVMGHLMASGEHAVGTMIAPEIAAKDDPQKMYETAKGDVDTALSAAAARSPAAAIKPPAPSIAELKTEASRLYKSPEVTDLEVKPTTIKNYSQTAQAVLNKEGFDENVAPKTFGILSKLESIPQGSTVTGQNFNSLRKMLGKAAGSIEPSEKAAASMAIDHLDSFIPAIPKADVIAGDVGAASAALENARGNYSAAKQSEKIDNKVVQAEVRAASANSGMNVANTIRQRMADVVLKPKEQRGLLPDEIAAAQQISEGTRGQNTLRAAGNILGGGGGLGTAIVGTIGGVATGGPGAALPLAGFALKALSNKMTINQAAKLSEMIRSRAPLASSAAKYNQAAAAVQQSRTPQAIAGAVLAARNFSNNLRSVGMNFSPADLMSGMLQSPSEGNAQQQDDVPRPPGQ